jgi:2',3'-cyclic-nucleotide 2'-phosphodiesterase (5'-nucleotidase family)
VIAAARAATAHLLRQGATVIVAVTHEDMLDDVNLAAAIPRIDLVVGGHDHLLQQATVGHTLITKSESDAHYLGVTTVAVGPGGRVRSMVERDYLIDPSSATPDPAMAALVKSYESRLSAQFNVVIGHTTVPLDAREITVRQKESPLGDLIADAMRAYAGTDVALMNGGGIRTDAVYPAGPITRKAIIAFLPFGNALVSVKITGAALKAALENGVSQVEAGAGRFPQVSGLRFTWSRHRPVGARILTVTINGQPLSATQIYTVATNDYMLGGGDGYTALAGGQVIITPNGGPLLATVVLDAVHKAGAIAPSTDGRITEMQ